MAAACPIRISIRRGSLNDLNADYLTRQRYLFTDLDLHDQRVLLPRRSSRRGEQRCQHPAEQPLDGAGGAAGVGINHEIKTREVGNDQVGEVTEPEIVASNLVRDHSDSRSLHHLAG